jgi:hypothetical protein
MYFLLKNNYKSGIKNTKVIQISDSLKLLYLKKSVFLHHIKFSNQTHCLIYGQAGNYLL